MEPPVDHVISARGLGRQFLTTAEEVWAVRDVDLDIRAGIFVCLLGASGSGKTTLLNLIAGLDVATTGYVEVVGRRVGDLSDAERTRLRLESVGVVFQDHNLIEELSAAENVALPLEVAGQRSSEAITDAGRALAGVGIGDLVERLPAQLSGGQRQRVGIARALAGSRRILLADEPTGALDTDNTERLFELIRKMCDDGHTAVVATHDHLAKNYADEVHELVDGGIRRLDNTLHRPVATSR